MSKQGRDLTQPERQKYCCKDCERWFDDLTGTVFTGHHLTQQPREGIECAQPEPVLGSEVEAGEVYVVAGHEGQPEGVKKNPARLGADA